MSYLGRSAKLSLKAQEKVSFLATAGQTSKTGLSYTVGFIEVYVNGVLLTDTTDFTATNGNSITFTVALLVNDEVTVVSLKTFTVADHYTKSAADTLLAAKSPIASPVFTGNVGVGVTPETWSTTGVVQVGRVSLTGTPSAIGGSLNWNAYYNSGWKYKDSLQAGSMTLDNGIFTFKVAPSGSADAAISWTTGLQVLNDGKARVPNGLLFGTDTAAANALDDYEEGTWTMAVVGASGSAGAWAMSGRVARYTKIGRVVHFAATGYLTNLGSYTGSSAIQITGLPFTNDSNISVACSASSIPIGQYNSTNYVPQVQGGASYLNIRKNQYGDSTAIYNEQGLNIRYNISGTYNVA